MVCEADLRGEGLPKACPRCKNPKPLRERVFSYIKQSKCEHTFRISGMINYTQIFSCEYCGKIKGVDVESVYNYDYPKRIDWDDSEPDDVEDENDDGE